MRPSEEIKSAISVIKSISSDIPSSHWDEHPWHVEKCDSENLKNCPCIIAQGTHAARDQAQAPPIQYIAEAETEGHAMWISLMHPHLATPLLKFLEREFKSAAQLENYFGDGIKDSDLPQSCQDALAISVSLIRTQKR